MGGPAYGADGRIRHGRLHPGSGRGFGAAGAPICGGDRAPGEGARRTGETLVVAVLDWTCARFDALPEEEPATYQGTPNRARRLQRRRVRGLVVLGRAVESALNRAPAPTTSSARFAIVASDSRPLPRHHSMAAS